MRMRAVLCLLAAIVLLPVSALGADESPQARVCPLLPLWRKQFNKRGNGRRPKLTPAKHLLREWVEKHLAHFPQDGDVGAFAETLNTAIKNAGLTCDDPNPN